MFESILYGSLQDDIKKSTVPVPDCLKDLDLDQIFAPIIRSTDVFDLSQVFYRPVTSSSTVLYRQEIMRDLDRQDAYELFLCFSGQLHKL